MDHNFGLRKFIVGIGALTSAALGLNGVVGIDFSVLMARHGSVYAASNEIAEAVESVKQSVDVVAHRQFVYVRRAEDLPAVAHFIADSLNLAPRQAGLATLGIDAQPRTQGEAAWVLAASSRLDRWTGGGAGDVSAVSSIWARPPAGRIGLATLGTPPWRDLVQGRPIGDTVFPLRLIKDFKGDRADCAAISVDFVAYNRAVRGAGGTIGFGVSDKMEEYARSLKFRSLVDDQQSHQLFSRRLSIQRQVDDFEDAVRMLISNRQGVLIPASSDGSIGNDGLLALVSQEMSQDLSAAIANLCTSLGVEAVIHSIRADKCTAEWLKQAERCLAAMKAARFLGVLGTSKRGICEICKFWVPAKSRQPYLDKQESIFRDCPMA